MKENAKKLKQLKRNPTQGINLENEILQNMVQKLQSAVVKPNNTSNNPLISQVGGDHYKKLGDYQPWNVMAHWLTPEELKGYMKGTICTYLCREADKGGKQDIEKALHTLEIYMEVSK